MNLLVEFSDFKHTCMVQKNVVCCVCQQITHLGRCNSNMSLTFIGPYIANIFVEYNQKDAKFHNFFISVRRSTCFRRVFRPSSGAQNCTYGVRYLSDRYCYLLLAAGSSNALRNIPDERRSHIVRGGSLEPRNPGMLKTVGLPLVRTC